MVGNRIDAENSVRTQGDVNGLYKEKWSHLGYILKTKPTENFAG